MGSKDAELKEIDDELDRLERIPGTIIEAGQRLVNVGFRVMIRDICEFNDIKEGDIVTIYIKKTNINKRKHD